MAEDNIEQFARVVNGFSGDLLHRFVNGRDFAKRVREESINGGEEEEGEVELSLGLSLNGKFGVDPKRAKTMKLTRSSSVSFVVLGGEQARVLPNALYPPLARTCSLPTETEEEWRKRKELQSLRRLEAKKRRMEKLKFMKTGREKVDSEENSCEENESNIDSNGQDSVNNNSANGLPLSQGSIGSQGSASSGLSEFESPPLQVKQNNEARSPSSMQCQPLQNKQKPANSPAMATNKLATFSETGKAEKETTSDIIKKIKLDMPSVSTTGDGPNGKKIDGFLYRYRKGEEVSIVCVCHGSFLSPAEFVKHAGGSDVEHPLRHIVVNTQPFL